MLWMRSNKYADTYEKQEKVAAMGFVTEVPNFIAKITTCFLTQSLIVWADFINTFQNILHYGIVAVISHKMKGDTGDKYNYGIERIDSFASLVCDFIMVMGFVMVAVYSVYGFMHPTPPSDSLYWFLLIKAINILVDVYLILQHLEINKKHHVKISETELSACTSRLLDDSVITVIAVIAFIFRDLSATGYLSPAYCFCSSIYSIIDSVKHIKTSVDEITDKALPIEKQDEIVDLVLAHTKQCRRIHSVNSRVLNNVVKIDLDIMFRDETTYREQMDFLSQIEQEIGEIIENSKVSIVFQHDENI